MSMESNSIERACDAARADYSARMSRVRDAARCLHSRTLAQAHEAAVTEVLRDFDAAYQEHTNFNEHRNSMLQDIENRYEEFVSINERNNKRAVDEALQGYDTRINEFWGSKSCVHPLDLKEECGRAREAATRHFLQQRSAACRDHPGDSYNRRMDYGLNHRDSKLNKRNKDNNEEAVSSAYMYYRRNSEREHVPPTVFMGIVMRDDGPDYSVGARHVSANKGALELFWSLRRGPSRSPDEYYDKLLKDIQNLYDVNFSIASSSLNTNRW